MRPGVDYRFKSIEDAQRAIAITPGWESIFQDSKRKSDQGTKMASGQWFADVDHFQTNMCSFAIECSTESDSQAYSTSVYHSWLYDMDGYWEDCSYIHDWGMDVYTFECLNPNGCAGIIGMRYKFFKCPMEIPWQGCSVGYDGQDPLAFMKIRENAIILRNNIVHKFQTT